MLERKLSLSRGSACRRPPCGRPPQSFLLLPLGVEWGVSKVGFAILLPAQGSPPPRRTHSSAAGTRGALARRPARASLPLAWAAAAVFLSLVRRPRPAASAPAADGRVPAHPSPSSSITRTQLAPPPPGRGAPNSIFVLAAKGGQRGGSCCCCFYYFFFLRAGRGSRPWRRPRRASQLAPLSLSQSLSLLPLREPLACRPDGLPLAEGDRRPRRARVPAGGRHGTTAVAAAGPAPQQQQPVVVGPSRTFLSLGCLAGGALPGQPRHAPPHR